MIWGWVRCMALPVYVAGSLETPCEAATICPVGGTLPPSHEAAPVSSRDDLLQHNLEYARTFDQGGLPTEPARRLAVVACMDSRIDLFAVLGLHNGEAHIIRNAGGVVTDDVIRSLIISQRLLNTTEILVLQHTRCGLYCMDESSLRRRLLSDTGLTPHFAFESFDNLEGNLRQSLARLRASPFIAKDMPASGVIYDVDTGRLREVS